MPQYARAILFLTEGAKMCSLCSIRKSLHYPQQGGSMRRSILVVAVLVFASGMFVQNALSQSNRMKHQIGVHVGLLGDPYPTLVGFNANYNAMDWLRATAGFGQISADVSDVSGTATFKATTFGFGARFFVPDWSFSPVGGISWATVSVTVTGTALGDVAGFSGSGSHLYATIGFDWQTGMGFSLGGGYNMSFKSAVPGVPYINLGWYF